jgi:hypothetical protein
MDGQGLLGSGPLSAAAAADREGSSRDTGFYASSQKNGQNFGTEVKKVRRLASTPSSLPQAALAALP